MASAASSFMLPSSSLPDDWLPVVEAVRLTGLTDRQWQRRAVELAGESLAHQAPPRGGRGKPIWWIHRSADPRLSRYPDSGAREDRARSALLERFPVHAVERAHRKAFWLRKWRDRCSRPRVKGTTERTLAAAVAAEAKRIEGPDFPVSPRTLQAWHAAYNALGTDGQIRGVEALIDNYAGPRPADPPGSQGGGGEACANRSPEAVEYFYRLYHTQQGHSVRLCHEVTLQEAANKGWSWPASYTATGKWLKAHDKLSVSFLLREGPDAWCRRFMPHIEIDYRLIKPGQLYQTDHHQCDFWVEDVNGKQIRPWLTVVQDMRSRAITGWNLGPSPHQDAIIATYLMAFRDWAIPERIRIDNGKDFTSELLTGVTKTTRDRLRRKYGRDWHRILKRDADLVTCTDPRFLGIVEELGIESIYAIPYAPWSKGTTERWFGTFEGRCGKTFATYCGNNALSKPDCLDVIRRGYTKDQKRRFRKRYGREWKKRAVLKLVDQSAVPTLDDARAAIGEYILEYHHTAHGADDMDGRTPLQTWQTASRLRRAGGEELLSLMHARGIYRVGPNGVAFKVGGVRLSYGAGSPALYAHVGRDVFISLDPHELSCCYAFTPDRGSHRFIARLEANKRISPMADVDELRRANAAVGSRRKIRHQAQREAPAAMRDAADEMAAKRRERVDRLRATGTDDARPHANIVPVRTGFEGATNAVRTPQQRGRKSRDLSDVATALGYGHPLPESRRTRPRATLDMLEPVTTLPQTASPGDPGDECQGTDAEQPKPDLLSLVAGNRHERAER